MIFAFPYAQRLSEVTPGDFEMTLKVVKPKITNTDTTPFYQWQAAIETPLPSENEDEESVDETDKVMFFYPVGKDQRGGVQHQVPDSAPPATTNTPDAFRKSADLTPKASTRKINSTPVAGRVTKRFLEENGYPAPLDEMTSFSFDTTMQGPKTAGMKSEAMFYGGGLHPAKTGTYGAHLNVQLKAGMNRVTSQQGIVESVDEEHHSGEQFSSEGELHSNRRTITNPYPGDNPPPIAHPAFAYTKNVYTGTWENNPAVVCLLSTHVLRLTDDDIGSLSSTV